MKMSKKIVGERRNKILEVLERVGDVKVEELCETLHVTPITIRRDLQYLEDHELVERYYGGVRIKNTPENYELRDETDIYRERIAKFAASLVEDGDTIFINTSSTALAMVPYIHAKNVVVITNNGNAITIPHSAEVTIILTGGELRHIKGTMVGEFALDNINMVSTRKTFLGCSGLSSQAGMTTDILNEVKINEAMLHRCVEKAYILADHKKIGKTCSFVSCPLETLTHIITDEKADKSEVSRFIHQGIKVIQVTKE